MSRRVPILVGAIVLAAAIPALASEVSVSSRTLDVYRSCVLTGVSSAATAGIDTEVDQQNPTANFGAATAMSTEARNNQNRRVYVRFDLALCNPAIPAGAEVVAAELDLFVTARPAACRTIDVFRLSSTWTEGSITWSNQPVGAAVNSPPTAQRSAFTTIGSAVGCQYTAVNTYASWTVTSDVAAWVSGAAANHGWMLRDDSEGGGTSRTVTFSTAEANIAARGPRLEITYR